MRIIFAIFPILIFTSTALGGFFVGNGGEGIRTGEQVELRDFAEYGVIDPQIGHQVNDAIARQYADWNQAPSEFPKSLLLEKLNDLEQIQLHFGRILFDVLTRYTWVFTDQPLALLPDDGSAFHYSDEQRLQIATRFENTIFINRAAWMKLRDVAKVGLLIHEAVYSLQTPVCSNGCQQLSYVTRELVATLFRNDPRPSPAQLASIGLPALAPIHPTECRFEQASGSLKVFDDPIQFKNKTPSISQELTLDHEAVDHFCALAEKHLGASTMGIIDMGIQVPPYLIIAQPFETADHGQQVGLQVIYQPWRLERADHFYSSEDCRSSLIGFVESWRQARIYTPIDEAKPCASVLMGLAADN